LKRRLEQQQQPAQSFSFDAGGDADVDTQAIEAAAGDDAAQEFSFALPGGWRGRHINVAGSAVQWNVLQVCACCVCTARWGAAGSGMRAGRAVQQKCLHVRTCDVCIDSAVYGGWCAVNYRHAYRIM
jgi:hypothetical protein